MNGHGRRKIRAAWRRGGRAYRFEPLEARLALDGRVVITELVASNDQGLEDEDGDQSDWIELFNDGDQFVDLNGWYLTDDMQNLHKWSFPSQVLQPQEYLVVFATSKDRRDPTGNLHTNFNLRAGGEDLALVEPDGFTVADSYRPFPALDTDRAFGLPQSLTTQTVIAAGAPLRALVPLDANEDGDWTALSYDDVDWLSGVNGVGYEKQTGFEPFIGTDISPQMYDLNSSVYVRLPFQLDRAEAVFSLTLRMRYDDGYVAYLNGVQVAARNAPAEPQWDSTATASHVDSQAVEFEDVDLTAFIPQLRTGENVLAIHGLNSSDGSNDFLIAPELVVGLPGPLLAAAGRHFATPTPGSPNGAISYADWSSAPTGNVPRGIYDRAFDLVATTRTTGATLVYTTDGSLPTLENGIQVAAASAQLSPVSVQHVARTTTFRMRAFKEDYLPSRQQTWTYIFPADVMTQDESTTLAAGFPEAWRTVAPDYGLDSDVIGPQDLFGGIYRDQFIASLKSIPTISIVMDVDDMFGSNGIYSYPLNGGREWERPTSVEIVAADGTIDFQVDAGIRIAGGASREHNSTKKKSFRLVFRREFGAGKLKFPLFGETATDRFDSIVLRNNYNDGWQWRSAENHAQYLRDEWTRATQLAMGQVGSHGTFVHLYINGIYWGLYNPVERPDANFTSAYLGGEDDEWDALNTGVVVDGSDDAWQDLLDLAAQVDTSDAVASHAAYQQLLGRRPDGSHDPSVEPLLDVDNLIDYMILNFYVGNTDWPSRNWYAGRRDGPNSDGFQFFAWDNEWVLNLRSTLTTDRTGVEQGVAKVYGHLRSNDEFRLRFADRVQKHFSPGGTLYVNPQQTSWDPRHPETNAPAARYQQLADQIELALIAESARWGDQHVQPAYTPGDWQRERDELLTDYFPRRSEIVWNQVRQAGLYPDVAVPELSRPGGVVPAGSQLTLTVPGTIFYTLDGSDPRTGLEGNVDSVNQVSPSAQLYSGPITLNGSILVKARTRLNGNWSALQEATYFAGSPTLRVSEIMYHPADPSPAEREAGHFSDDDFEFVEIRNISTQATMALAGVRFTDGITFDLTQSAVQTLGPGQAIVVARDSEALQARYGRDLPIAGEYGGTSADLRLSNNGERIEVVDGSGTIIQQFVYSDRWHPSTAGQGASLEIVDARDPELASWSLAQAWRPSDQVGGSPAEDEAIGDFNADGLVNGLDLDLICAAVSTSDPRFDLSQDGVTDRVDLTFFVTSILHSSFGDADLDGTFDSGDLVLIFQAGEYEDTTSGNSTWSEGDWNCDGEFTTSDLVLAFQTGRYEAKSRPNTSELAAAVDWLFAAEQRPARRHVYVA